MSLVFFLRSFVQPLYVLGARVTLVHFSRRRCKCVMEQATIGVHGLYDSRVPKHSQSALLHAMHSRSKRPRTTQIFIWLMRASTLCSVGRNVAAHCTAGRRRTCSSTGDHNAWILTSEAGMPAEILAEEESTLRTVLAVAQVGARQSVLPGAADRRGGTTWCTGGSGLL